MENKINKEHEEINTEAQRIELACIYRKSSLKQYSEGEREWPLISGTTTVGSNNNDTANAPRAKTRATIDNNLHELEILNLISTASLLF